MLSPLLLLSTFIVAAQLYTIESFVIIPGTSLHRRWSLSCPWGTAHATSPSLMETARRVVPDDWEEDVRTVLSLVIDPDLNADIVSLGFVQNLALADGGVVSFDVELTTPACPVKGTFKAQSEELVSSLPWVDGVEVNMTARPPPTVMDKNDGGPFGMSAVASVVAVSSCKGGVGKSTTAVNLAYALADAGARVGIFDVDLFGPSLPTMVVPESDAVEFVGRQIKPLERNGVKLMSFGYVNDGAAIMRGPMITQLLDQFLSMVCWGELDYLVLDMPPGTGDIQLTLSQRLNITAAVIVTTPQELSYVDVARGVDMFQEVNVPCVAVVENMAYVDLESERVAQTTTNANLLQSAFTLALEESSVVGSSEDADAVSSLAEKLVALVKEEENRQRLDAISNDDGGDDSKLRIFGPGHLDRLSRQWGIEHSFAVPLLSDIASMGDSGKPFFAQRPDSEQADIYRDLASAVAREVSKVRFAGGGPSGVLELSYDRLDHMIRVGGLPADLRPADLRRDCRCASCVEELTGRQILRPTDVSDSVRPIDMRPCGNYAVSVDWSDGHRSLYPYKQIRSLVEEKGVLTTTMVTTETETTVANSFEVEKKDETENSCGCC